MELDVHVLHCPGMLFFASNMGIFKYLLKPLHGKEKCFCTLSFPTFLAIL